MPTHLRFVRSVKVVLAAALMAVICSAQSTISAGGAHSLFVASNGTVRAWGSNFAGQLGDGTTTDRWSAVQVSGLTSIVSVAAGGSHSLALRSDGTVWAWGSNNLGQLGDGTTATRYVPVQVSGLSGVIAIAAGENFFSLALKNDGTAWAWGYNFWGQLGDGTTDTRYVPVRVLGLTQLTVSIAAGSGHALAVAGNGTVRAWGFNATGQLGNGTTTNSSIPVQVSGLTGITAVAAGIQSLALKRNGTVWGWGFNGSGSVGDGTTVTRLTPVQVGGLANIDTIGAGTGHSFAVRRNGALWTWGLNDHGQLGDGTTTNRLAPVRILTGRNVAAIDGGDRHSLALLDNGNVFAWGLNQNGEIGDGTNIDRLTPVRSGRISRTGPVITANDPVFGPGSLTRDTISGLDWLDWTMSAGRSFTDVSNQLGTGGDFEGFRYATTAEVAELFADAAVPDIEPMPFTVTPFAANFVPVSALMSLLGVTSPPNSSYAITADSPAPLVHFTAVLATLGSVGYASTRGTSVGDNQPYAIVGHALVRAR